MEQEPRAEKLLALKKSIKTNIKLACHIILISTMKISAYSSLFILTSYFLLDQKFVQGFQVIILKIPNQNPKATILEENSEDEIELKVNDEIAKFICHFRLKRSMKKCKRMFRSSRIF